MSDEIRLAQTQFQEAIQKINQEKEPGLHALAQGLNLLAQGVVLLESEFEKLNRASQYPRN